MPVLSFEQRELKAQPILLIRREVAQSEIAAALGQCLGAVFGHCQKNGLTMAGPPLVRYPSVSPGLLTMEAACQVTETGAGEGEIEAGTLQAGATAVALHAGPYDELRDAYAALERWIADQGLRPNGAPWEVYLTDPGEVPDPQDWRTEIYWPVADTT